mmetsp:Transcript_46762/g.89309  ORF Transcript_46762/g.89309 Transcript_46762/m.89309 type:complete len:245 (-) Transcript_46762:570-1304(-)
MAVPVVSFCTFTRCCVPTVLLVDALFQEQVHQLQASLQPPARDAAVRAQPQPLRVDVAREVHAVQLGVLAHHLGTVPASPAAQKCLYPHRHSARLVRRLEGTPASSGDLDGHLAAFELGLLVHHPHAVAHQQLAHPGLRVHVAGRTAPFVRLPSWCAFVNCRLGLSFGAGVAGCLGSEAAVDCSSIQRLTSVLIIPPLLLLRSILLRLVLLRAPPLVARRSPLDEAGPLGERGQIPEVCSGDQL